MAGILTLWVVLIFNLTLFRFEQLIESKKFLMMGPCVICCGQIQKVYSINLNGHITNKYSFLRQTIYNCIYVAG